MVLWSLCLAPTAVELRITCWTFWNSLTSTSPLPSRSNIMNAISNCLAGAVRVCTCMRVCGVSQGEWKCKTVQRSRSDVLYMYNVLHCVYQLQVHVLTITMLYLLIHVHVQCTTLQGSVTLQRPMVNLPLSRVTHANTHTHLRPVHNTTQHALCRGKTGLCTCMYSRNRLGFYS